MSASETARDAREAWEHALSTVRSRVHLNGIADTGDVVMVEVSRVGGSRLTNLRDVLYRALEDLPEGRDLDILAHSTDETYRVQLDADVVDAFGAGEMSEDEFEQRLVRSIKRHSP